MKSRTVLFDIIHPANVHYFKITIKRLKSSGFNVIVTAREKEMSTSLLDAENIEYIKMGRNPQTTVGKLLFLLWCEIRILFIFLKYKPEIALSFGASYIAHNSFLFGVSHIALDDTEHATLNRKLYLPFTDLVLTPESYQLDLGKKHVKFPGHMELFYLSEKYFKPDISIYKLLGIDSSEKFAFLRFVSWSALHDKGQNGLSNKYKIKLVEDLASTLKVFISAEGEMPIELEKFRIKIPPHLVHHVLYYAELYVGEGATMASECAAIGTPSIYVNSLNAGTLINQEKEGLLFNFRQENGVSEIVWKILNNPNSKKDCKDKLMKLNKSRIDLTDFLVWLVINYPESKYILLTNKDWTKQFQLT
jgi:uncharacterized protein